MDKFSNNFLYFDKLDEAPNLISNNTINEIQKTINGGILETPSLSASIVPEKIVNDGASNFYDNYIKPNMFFIILATLFLLFLYWKYETKNSTHEKELYGQVKNKKYYSKIDDLIADIESGTYNSMKKERKQVIPNFNPSIPVSAQNNFTNYTDNEVPLLINNKKQTYGQVFKNPLEDQKLEYIPIIKNKINRGDTYTGLFNDYNNYEDQNYNHPFDWEKNYNQSTYDAINFATDRNRNNIAILNNIVDNANIDLVRNIG